MVVVRTCFCGFHGGGEEGKGERVRAGYGLEGHLGERVVLRMTLVVGLVRVIGIAGVSEYVELVVCTWTSLKSRWCQHGLQGGYAVLNLCLEHMACRAVSTIAVQYNYDTSMVTVVQCITM